MLSAQQIIEQRLDEVQFLTLKPIVRKVEAYFDARGAEKDADDIKLYFERRNRQFVGQGIPDIRIFDMKEVARAVAAMFLERPDLAARYPTQMFDELSNGAPSTPATMRRRILQQRSRCTKCMCLQVASAFRQILGSSSGIFSSASNMPSPGRAVRR